MFQARWKVGARYLSAKTPDGRPLTFTTEKKARLWLAGHREAILNGTWLPGPAAAAPGEVTLAAYADGWLASRNLADRSRDHYRQLVRDHIAPTFGERSLASITPADVRTWHGGLATGPTATAHAYGLLKAILATAAADDLIDSNPCRVRAGGQAPTVKQMRPATLDELAVLTEAMPERLRMLVQLAVWCSLRFGEAAELRRSDVDLDRRLVHVRRAVVRAVGGTMVKAPKSDAGVRSVTIPRHVVDELAAHLADHVEPDKNALLFPAAHGGHLAPATLYRSFYRAREAAGRPDLRFHDLRHTGQTLAARAGADLRELMNRAGQSTSSAALRYIHEVNGRQAEIADAMSALAEASRPGRDGL
ncbi:MAG: tyrosine-type recombinase/integrase [Janthinobacterium lividum]